jgi:hypothetical protein
MPRASTLDTPIAVDLPMIEIRTAELGDQTVSFERHKADSDPAPLFVGLPDDRCQCPHHGYVKAGRIVFRYADHDETYEAGDAYVATPGHLPLMFAGTELVEFSTTSDLGETMAVIEHNLAASMAGS